MGIISPSLSNRRVVDSGCAGLACVGLVIPVNTAVARSTCSFTDSSEEDDEDDEVDEDDFSPESWLEIFEATPPSDGSNPTVAAFHGTGGSVTSAAFLQADQSTLDKA